MPWNSNLWNSKAVNKISRTVNYYKKKKDSELRMSIAKSIEIVVSDSIKIRMVG